jgi:hypothetical protein
MYVFLLVLGSFIAVAGLGLVASGVSVQEHTFDASNLTPAMIAVIGGCILVGLGLVVRALLRVELALMRAPVPRPMRSGEAVGSVALAQESEAASIPFPPKPKPKAIPQTQTASAPASAMPPPAAQADTTLDGLQTSAQERLESTPVVEESDVSLLPKPPARADEDSAEVHHGGGRANGSAHATTEPRVAANGRPIRPPQVQAKVSIFDALWPKQQRTALEVQVAPAESAVTPPALQVSHQAEAGEPSPPAKSVATPLPERAVVSVLKSGVVEGMAYTLYSDGSIEAQLPGGTLRFGSITELRNHIEQHG